MAQKCIHVIVGSTNWHADQIKFRRHRLAEFLLKQRDTEKVIWVYPITATIRKPASFIYAFKQIFSNLLHYNEKLQLFGLLDIIPGRLQRRHGLLQGLFLAILKKNIQCIEGNKYLWYTMPAFPYIAYIDSWTKIVYDCSDLWTAQKGASYTFLSEYAIRGVGFMEAAIVQESDLLFATSEFLVKYISEKYNRNATLLENGVDLQLFSKNDNNALDILDYIYGYKLGFVGMMKPKIDFRLLSRIAKSNNQWNIILVGAKPAWKNADFDEVIDEPNVFWLGEVCNCDVPKYLNCIDVGLLPYKEIEYNEAVFPLKLFEYFAAGLPVVGCGLPSTEKYQGYGIYKHTSNVKFADGCVEALSWGKNKILYDKRIKMAKNKNWDNIFVIMYNSVIGVL